jgi:hypothetical protein
MGGAEKLVWVDTSPYWQNRLSGSRHCPYTFVFASSTRSEAIKGKPGNRLRTLQHLRPVVLDVPDQWIAGVHLHKV